MNILQEHMVPSGVTATRLSDYANGIFESLPSRKSVKKAIKKGAILVDNRAATTGTWIKAGMRIQLVEVEQPLTEYELPLDVIYEDDFLAVINKPAGIPVSGNRFRTVANALAGNLYASTQKDALHQLRPVHRLDGPTSGLLLIAKTAQANVELGKLFVDKRIKKCYSAIVIGKTPAEGKIDLPLDGKTCCSRFQRLEVVPSLKNQYLSLLELQPLTGRTHQLRRHLAAVGHPIMGDKIYGQEGMILKGKGLFLSATRLTFEHPFTPEIINLAISPPNKFRLLLERERRRWER